MEENPRLELLYEGGKGWVYGKKKVDFSLNKCGLDEIKNRVKPLFDQVLEKINSRILPVLNAHGKMVDLFELFWAVRKIGGYDLVSRKNSWGDIAEECGFDFEEKVSMKLIYVKYLSELDRCLPKTEIRLGNDGTKILEKLELLLARLNQGGGVLLDVEENKNDKTKNNLSLLDRSSFFSPRRNQTNDFANGNLIIDGEKDFLENENDAVENGDSLLNEKLIDVPVGEFNCFDEKSYAHHKRNRESDTVPCSNKRRKERSPWIETLDWISHVATHFDDPGTGILSECLKKKERGDDPLWNQALLARKLLLVKQHNADSEASHNQKYKMHPAMFEGIMAPSRTSQRIPLVKCHYGCTCDNPFAKHNRVPEKKGTREPLRDVDVSKRDNKPEKYWEKKSEMHSLLGREFQAEVPECTGEKPASDSKWLGQQIWTPKNANFKEVGKGRPLKCDCSFPGSTGCIRFHIADKRLVLKRDINSAFYKWKFDQMGEEVSLAWTEEEEKKFKDMIKFYSTDRNKFWRIAPKCFPSKTREKMVRYYFNVLVLRRRSYQNRVTPSNLDSDDDEKDFGAVGSSFSHRSMCFVDPTLGVCSLNMQCTDFDYPEHSP